MRASILRDFLSVAFGVFGGDRGSRGLQDVSKFVSITASRLCRRSMDQMELPGRGSHPEAILRSSRGPPQHHGKVRSSKKALREDAHNTIALAIDAELWGQPLPLRCS